MTLPDAALFPAHPSNYGSRHNLPVELVVIHCTEGAFHSACLWFANPSAKASAHYIVSRNGAIAQCVPEGCAAWHAGNSAVNRESIGVELEGYAAQPTSFPPDSLLLSAAAHLVADVCDRHHIPVDRAHIIGHAEVPNPYDPTKRGGMHGHQDPGNFFPWTEFVAQVRGLAEHVA